MHIPSLDWSTHNEAIRTIINRNLAGVIEHEDFGISTIFYDELLPVNFTRAFHPLFAVTKVGNGVICRVLFWTGVPVQKFVQILNATKISSCITCNFYKYTFQKYVCKGLKFPKMR